MSNAPRAPLRVPHTALSEAALRGLLEAFVLREGTDYGTREVSLADKVAEVRRQLERGDAVIVFDPESGSVDIVPAPGLYSGRGRAGHPLDHE